MDLSKITMSLRAKEEWDTDCLPLDVYEEPGIDSSSLPIQKNIAAFFPKVITPYFQQGGGIAVSLECFCTCFSSAPSIVIISQVIVPLLVFHCPHPALTVITIISSPRATAR
jgi:hypothetical protein